MAHAMDDHVVHRFWGQSPAIDLGYAAACAAAVRGGGGEEEAAEAPLRCLLAAPADCRHLVTTLGRWRRRDAGARRCEVTLYEEAPEELARHLLLLSVLLHDALPPRERSEVFLELLMNARIRDRTAAYLEGRGRLLAEVVGGTGAPGEGVDPEEVRRLSALFDVSKLKFKERDDLVAAFASWAVKVPFDMEEKWDWRLRKFFGDRYDFRKNMLDWDYHMRLDPAGGDIIHFVHFREWRQSGIAYDPRDWTFPAPNRSLVSMAYGRTVEFKDRNLDAKGRSVAARGYWGDVQNSPYHAFGTQTEEASLLKVVNKQHVKTAVDVCEYNVAAVLHELRTGERYQVPSDEEQQAEKAEAEAQDKAATGATLEEVAEEEEEDLNAIDEDDGKEPAPEPPKPEAPKWLGDGELAAETWGRFKITLLSGDIAKQLTSKAKFEGHFDVVTLGAHQAHLLKHGLGRVTREGGLLAAEGGNFFLPFKKEHADAFAGKVKEMATEAGLAPWGDKNPEDIHESHLLFVRAAAGAVAPAE